MAWRYLEMIYKLQVTVIELARASPCLMSLVLMSMESKYRQQPSNVVFDEEANMARHRYGARGNVCSFPLPMEALLKQLEEHMSGAAGNVPRSGKELGEVFRVILKTSKTGKTTDQEIKTLIHQAKVRRQAGTWHEECRRFFLFAACLNAFAFFACAMPAPFQVVVDLIMELKKLGHPSFANLEDAAVRDRAAQLPEDGVPPEVLKIIHEDLGGDDAPFDSKLMPQKAATPCEAPERDLAAAGATFAAGGGCWRPRPTWSARSRKTSAACAWCSHQWEREDANKMYALDLVVMGWVRRQGPCSRKNKSLLRTQKWVKQCGATGLELSSGASEPVPSGAANLEQPLPGRARGFWDSSIRVMCSPRVPSDRAEASKSMICTSPAWARNTRVDLKTWTLVPTQ